MKNFEAYRDVKDILDKALAASGGKLVFKTHGEAVRWRQRAYAFRKGWRESSTIASIYERIMFPQIDRESNVLEIKVQATDADFIPNNPDAAPITPPEAEPDFIDYDEALAKARKIMKEEGLDFDPNSDVL